MSELRRERKQERDGVKPEKTRNWGMLALYGILIVAAFGLVYYLGQRNQHKYDKFAQCLNDRGVKMYGAWWCPHCQDQKKEFAEGYKFLPYVECGIPGDVKGRSQACLDANIKKYPTWQFPPMGERLEQVMSLEAISDKSGCPLP